MKYSKIAIQVKENGMLIKKIVRVPATCKYRIFFDILKRKYYNGFVLFDWKNKLIED